MKLGSIVAYTGTHGVGKTTAAFKKAHELKIQHKKKKIGILIESTLDCPFSINRNTSSASQLWMFTKHLNNELTLLTLYDLIVSDRTIFDYIAYTEWSGDKSLSYDMLSIAKKVMNNYEKIYFKTIKNNEYLSDDNHRDSNDLSFRESIELILKNIYPKIGMIGNQDILDFD